MGGIRRLHFHHRTDPAKKIDHFPDWKKNNKKGHTSLMVVLSELSLLTILLGVLLCPSCGQTENSGHVSGQKGTAPIVEKIHNTNLKFLDRKMQN